MWSITGLRPATPSHKHGLYWLYHMWFFWMKPLLVENVIGWECHWMRNSLDEIVVGWKCHWMKVSLDETVFGWECRWMKSCLETVSGWNRFWMKVYSANTLPAVCIEKRKNMKSGEELCSKMHQSPEWSGRIVLKPNLHYGRQDITNFEARASVDDLTREYGENAAVQSTGRPVEVTSTSESKIVTFNCPTTRWSPQRSSQKIDSTIWNASQSRSVESRPGKGSSVQPTQREVEGHDPQHGKHGALRDVRDHFQSTVPQLCNILDDKHCTLYLRNILAIFKQKSQIKRRSLWCFIDSELGEKERTISTKTRKCKKIITLL